MAAQLERLDWEIVETTSLFRLLDERRLHTSVYSQWDALDVLRHVVWWHESFATIVTATVANTKPDVPRGTLAEVNARSVADLKSVGVTALIRRFDSAQRTIQKYSTKPEDTLLHYRRGSRTYSFNERVEIAVGEIHAHRRDVLKAVLASHG
jgi:hypothetical protein